MKHSIPHDLGKEGAKRAAAAALAHYQERFATYGTRADWVTDDRAEVSFSTKGFTLNGALEVRATTIEIDLDVPFMLRPFKGVALERVDREVGAWIEKAKRGDV